jgi:hypothetical protein
MLILMSATKTSKQMTQDNCKAKSDINLGLYDCPDDASDDLAFSGGMLDDDVNPLEVELRHSHQIDSAPVPMHLLHHRMPVINRRILHL